MSLREGEGASYTSIGIVIAISGNVLISLALNIQKRAHGQVHDSKTASPNRTPTLSRHPSSNNTPNNHHYDLADTRPLLPTSTSSPRAAYGTTKSISFFGFRKPSSRSSEPSILSPTTETVHDQDDDELDEVAASTETDYLRSKLWWFGFLLMNIGELGNFLSYAYAPASLVAPLGTVALVANCFFAPLMLGERFKHRDFLGIVLAIIGSVTIVLSSKPTDIRLDKDGLIRAITQPIFIAYTILTAVAILLLTMFSRGNAGREWIYVDVGICALYGGFTVLATKGLSTLLSLKFIQIYKLWITYPLIVVLLGTGIGQIRYLNRALMKFDSKHVIPTQFVMFTLTAIIGSAILYRDFEDITLHKMISFIYGVLTVFLAIFILTYSPPTPSAGTHPLVTLDDPISAITSPISPTSPNDTLPESHTAVNINGNKYVLRTKTSTAKLGISPGQYLLLAASPPTDREGDFGSTRSRRARSYAQENERSRSRSREGGRRRTIHFEDATPR